MTKKKKEEKNLIGSFLYLVIVFPYRLASSFLKLLIGIPIGLFKALVQYSKEHY